MRNPIRPNHSPTPPQQTPQPPAPPPPPPPPTPPAPPVSLIEPVKCKRRSSSRTIRAVRSMLRSFPIITPAGCRLPSLPSGSHSSDPRGGRTTCTFYGLKKGHVTVSFQDSPGCLPSLLLELPVLTNALHKELRTGMVRIALECEKKSLEQHAPTSRNQDGCRLLEEEVWSMFWNGKKGGFGVRRDANDADLHVMELLKVVTMGVGVVPALEGSEVAYIRANFEHVVGSKDSETFYMLTPEGNNAPELTIFFVRL